MKQLIVIICLLMEINVMAENPEIPYGKKKNCFNDSLNIQLQELEFRDDIITNIVVSCVPEIRDSCKLQSKTHYIRMYFSNDVPMQIVMYPEILLCHFTIDFWRKNRKDIIGYLYVDEMLVIVQGRKVKKNINKRKGFKALTIKNYPPSNARDWSFWRYTINNNAVIKEKHLTKTPYILY